MDAKEFLRERQRMCEFYKCCEGCPADVKEMHCYVNTDKIVDIVEQWSKLHPIITNRMKFEEVFGLNHIPGSCRWWDEEYKEVNK